MQKSGLEERLDSEVRWWKERDTWKGGYFEGDPLDPLASSSYATLGYMSVLHATYLRCIKPYMTADTSVVEIGPGRGAWTKTFLDSGAKEVWCLDVKSREFNGFDEYLGQRANVRYFEVSDFACSDLPDDHFDYMFSFGCFCHISFSGIQQYMTSLYPKLKAGADGFVMIADFDKYNRAIDGERFRIVRALLADPRNPLRRGWNWLVRQGVKRKYYEGDFTRKHKLGVDTPSPGRFFHAGTNETCDMLMSLGYQIVDPDVGTNLRDPIIQFRKRAIDTSG